MFSSVVGTKEIARTDDREVQLSIVIEIGRDHSVRISAHRVIDRSLETQRTRRALVDEDRNVVIDQVRDRDVDLAVAVEISEDEGVRICSHWSGNCRLKGAVTISF